MGVYTSTVRLIADTAQAESALNRIDKKLDDFESGKHEATINLNDTSAQKKITDLKKALEDAFNNKNIDKVFGDKANGYRAVISQILDDVTNLENTDITMKAKADCSQLYKDMDAARSTFEEMLTIKLPGSASSKDLLGYNSGLVTISDDADREEARLQNAISSIKDLAKTYRAERKDLQIESTIQKNGIAYGDFESPTAQNAYKNQISAGKEAIEIYSTLIGLMDEAGNISRKSLLETFGEEGILALPSTLKQLEEQVKNTSDVMKIEADRAGFKSISKNYDTFKKSVEAVEGSLKNSDFDKQMSSYQKMIDSLSNVDTDKMEDVREQFSGMKQDLEDLKDCYDANTGKLDTEKLFGKNGWDEAKLEKFSASLKEFGNTTKNVTGELKDMGVNNNLLGKISDGTYAKQIDDFRNSISKLGDSEAKASLNNLAKGLEDTYSNMQNAIGSGTAEGYKQATQYAEEFTQQAKEANQAYQQFMLGGSSAGGGGNFTGGGGTGTYSSGSGGSWFSGLTSQLSSGLNSVGTIINRFAGYMVIYREIRQVAQDMIDTVTEVDTAMTQLQIVTGASSSEMDTFFESSISQAKELGQSVTDVLDTIQVYSRLGYDLADSSELAEYTSILSNVADVDVDEATTGLTSVIKGFDMEVSDAEHVADVLIDIGQNYAVSASEILEAFTHSSAAFGATGTTFEEASAIIAAGNAAVQDASTVGTAMKTVSARIRQSKTELDELGESYDDLADGFSKYRDEILQLTGFDIMEEGTTDDYKSLYDIFDGIAQVWGDLSETQQSRVSEILGGATCSTTGLYYQNDENVA